MALRTRLAAGVPFRDGALLCFLVSRSLAGSAARREHARRAHREPGPSPARHAVSDLMRDVAHDGDVDTDLDAGAERPGLGGDAGVRGGAVALDVGAPTHGDGERRGRDVDLGAVTLGAGAHLAVWS